MANCKCNPKCRQKMCLITSRRVKRPERARTRKPQQSKSASRTTRSNQLRKKNESKKKGNNVSLIKQPISKIGRPSKSRRPYQPRGKNSLKSEQNDVIGSCQDPVSALKEEPLTPQSHKSRSKSPNKCKLSRKPRDLSYDKYGHGSCDIIPKVKREKINRSAKERKQKGKSSAIPDDNFNDKQLDDKSTDVANTKQLLPQPTKYRVKTGKKSQNKKRKAPANIKPVRQKPNTRKASKKPPRRKLTSGQKGNPRSKRKPKLEKKSKPIGKKYAKSKVAGKSNLTNAQTANQRRAAKALNARLSLKPLQFNMVLTPDNFHSSHVCNRPISEMPFLGKSYADNLSKGSDKIRTVQMLIGKYLALKSNSQFMSYLSKANIDTNTCRNITNLIENWKQYNIDTGPESRQATAHN
ncbi:hypothetical protein GJ496_004469 [Pomphorhynchus laevis]|nr:hypothetical protein GJ496_004469 [Pomphorhynchus laevis]